MSHHPRAPLTAQHAGYCESCSSRINPGDVIVAGDQGWYHAVCEPILSDDFDLQPGESVCPECFCVHAGAECL